MDISFLKTQEQPNNPVNPIASSLAATDGRLLFRFVQVSKSELFSLCYGILKSFNATDKASQILVVRPPHR